MIDFPVCDCSWEFHGHSYMSRHLSWDILDSLLMTYGTVCMWFPACNGCISNPQSVYSYNHIEF